MSWRRIVVLLVLVAGLGAYLWLYEVPTARKEAQKAKLLGTDKGQVTGIDLVYPDREIALTKGDKGWRIEKPLAAAADDAAVTSLLGSLADAEVQKTLEEVPQDLAPFGLDKPTVTVRVTAGSTESPAVAVGRNTAIGGKTYVRKGDEPRLYLVSSTLGSALNKQVKDLRDKQVIAFQDDDVTRVDITAEGGQTTSLVRRDKDAWTVDPGAYPADLTEARSLLSTLRTTRAVDFPDEKPSDPGAYGFDTPRLRITVTTGKEGSAATQTLVFGKETTQGTQKQVYARRADAPTVYALGDWAVRSLGKDASQLRDKTVLGFDPTRIGQVVLTRRDGAMVKMSRPADGTWGLEGQDAAKVKPDAVSRFIDDVRDLRGSGIAGEPPGDLARFGLDAPDVRIALVDKDGHALGTLLAAKHDGKQFAMAEGGPTVFEVQDYMYSRLDKQQRDFVTGETAGSTPPPTVAAPAGGEPEEPDEPLEDEGAE